MGRALSIFIVAPTIALAAPIPPPTDKDLIARYWGTVYAPSEKYEFKPRGKALTMRTAGEPARETVPGKPSTIPRVFRSVKGDFEATVKLVAVSLPNPKARFESDMPQICAGLRVSGGFNYAQIELNQYHIVNNRVPREKRNRVVWFAVMSGGNGEGRHIENADPEKPLYLRIARKGKAVTLAHSFDGKVWGESAVPAAYQPLQLPDEVSVGVYLAHTTYQVADATFTDFTIKKPAEK